jgi:6-pyruvoyltetrahydropterin/6-carboxytetrahydropterin synthase
MNLVTLTPKILTKKMKISVCRKAHFNAAHRLYNPNWDMAKNDAVFGKCNNPNFHGHNYTLEVWVKGEINPDTGMVIDLKLLKTLIKAEIEERFDHKNLNLDTEEFKTLNPTAENICLTIWKILRDKLDTALELRVRLYETERNVVECDGA